MKKRSTEILQKLMKHPLKGYSIPKLARDYGVSQRTLRNDVNDMNAFLESVGEPVISIGNDGILLVNQGCDCRLVYQKLLKMDTYHYRLSSEERQVFLIATLLNSKDYVIMQDFADNLYVSRVTILNDVQALQKTLEEKDIYMVSDAGKGMKLICTMQQRIELMMMVYRQAAINVENEGFFQNFILERMNIRYPFSEIFGYLQEYVNSNNIIFVDDVLYDIVLYLFAVFNVIEQIDEKKRSPVLDPDIKLADLDHFMIDLGHRLNIAVTENMLRFYRSYLAEHNLRIFVKSIDEMELYKIIHYYLSEIDREMQLHLTMDRLLLDSLLMHIKNMKKWGGYEVELPEADNIAVDYELLQRNVEKHAYILERFLGYRLSDNMKKSIVIHICVALIRNQREMERLTVAIVCPGSMATGKYLESQVRNYFDFHIIGVISASRVFRQLGKTGEHVDFILSTVPLESEKYDCLTVHPFLTMDDLNRIQEKSLKCQKMKNSRVPRFEDDRVLSKMRNMMSSREMPESLKKEMEAVITDYERKLEKGKYRAIAELLREEYIQVTYEDLDWKEAMRLSAASLIADGNITTNYIEASIANVEEYGDYIIVGKGIAVAHANASKGVIRDGLSLLICPTGIAFSNEENIVYKIFCFASTGQKEYLDLVKEIAELSYDEIEFQNLLDRESFVQKIFPE